MTFTIAILAILALLALWGIGVYNHLIRLQNQVKNAWSQIDVQLQRRYDLIPNLVETVKGYMKYEQSTLESVIQARNQAQQARQQISEQSVPSGAAMRDLMAAETTLKGSLGNIFALAENYPQLKASETMAQLQEELRTTENKVAFARQAYNDQVMQYNVAQQTFPTNLIASAFGHNPAEAYQIEEPEAKKAVKVSF
ncbi:LemA family protein [Criblamydia sequanensis]|uniref:Membrane protein n=1 Tax=Candidatus Criblamydia sequanensis CRIB-18 TaxID=1437425 RepID=A0A090D1P8_9BACT|nr:LemA family protein [Criblamydia sequanensis]CDR33653.1 putative membrane protein [Criblamydia sequanensis CRIB-18]